MTRYRINEIKTDIDVPMSELPVLIARKTGIRVEDIAEWEVRRKSIDSRKKPYIQLVYTVDFVTARRIRTNKVHGLSIYDPEKDREQAPDPGSETLTGRPVVVGMGPAGLFAGLELARMGYRPLIIERGPAMPGRIEAVEKFRRERVLDPEANMLFGEGGAGTFSDGKIGTGIRDGLIRRVLADFRDAGAGDDIMYLAKPHIGTDVLRTVIVNLRHMIEELGGEVQFGTRLESLIVEGGRLAGIRVRRNPQDRGGSSDRQECLGDSRADGALEIRTNALILAIGHSARDTFAMIHSTGLDMEQKPFSIGVRMEHPQALIDAAQYGPENAGKLPPADYKINYRASNGRGVYSFCMCPGGEVVVCTTKEGELCVNGMSNRNRDSGTANSGILCDVRKEDFGSDDVLAGVRFQEKYERLAFINGGGDFTPPRCTMEEFLGADQAGTEAFGHAGTETSGHAQRVLRSLPDFAAEAIREAVPAFARKIHGYDDPHAVITAVETRSSSPVRIIRDAHGESNIKGIYPAGEGAGYAGGITSAACDGIRAAWHIVEKYARP
ncbi:MAG: NAD(FAD)-utilizing dehydrogenase [Mogibacterium sp.]|nr:NAD(FAD)-utilizing dehydrogenase [Mogibacterium sp.]